MKKKFLNCLLLIVGFLTLPSIVFATSSNSSVGTDLNLYQCTGSYQDSIISTNKDAYFSHCMIATCSSRTYNMTYYSNNKVNCTNGNSNPYYQVIKNGCSKYQNTICNENEIKYCSMIMYYDCSRTSNGGNFITTTTTTKKPSYRPKTTTTTTTQVVETTDTPITVAPNNTKLKTLTLSTGTLEFSPDTYTYDLNIAYTVNTIRVNAIPQDTSSTVSVSGYENLVDGSVIKIVVTGKDSSTSEYKINIKKDTKLSNNAKLKSLTIKDYDINFSATTNDYNLTIPEGVTSLDIEAIAEDTNAIALISNTNNLKSGSKINIEVTAQDGTKNVYVINIVIKKKSNFMKILFILVLILAVIAGGYYIYKKFIGSKKGEQYEYE